MTKLVSIVVPAYNRAILLPETLNSVLTQTYLNWECIIVDDGSSDSTKEVVHKWCNRDSRFKYFFQQNRGLSAARNFSLSKISGDLNLFSDSDDVILPTKIQCQVDNMILQNSDLDVCDFLLWDHESGLLYNQTKKPFPDKLPYLDSLIINWQNHLIIPPHCVLFKRTLIEVKFFQRFHEGLTTHEDWHFWVQVFYKSKKRSLNIFPLVYYRVHSGSSSHTSSAMRKKFILACEYLEEFFKYEGDLKRLKLVTYKKYILQYARKAIYFTIAG